MTKDKVKEIWNSLTDEQRAEANVKMRKVISESVDQEIALAEKRKKERQGERFQKLDGYDPEMQQISAEYRCRLNDLFEEYGFDRVENL